jgi:hypothetical protein
MQLLCDEVLLLVCLHVSAAACGSDVHCCCHKVQLDRMHNTMKASVGDQTTTFATVPAACICGSSTKRWCCGRTCTSGAVPCHTGVVDDSAIAYATCRAHVSKRAASCEHRKLPQIARREQPSLRCAYPRQLLDVAVFCWMKCALAVLPSL